jgi:phosphonate transport system permease protein
MWLGWLALVALFVWCWQVMTENTIWAFVADAPRLAADIGGRMVPPRLSYLPELMVPLWDTINIATRKIAMMISCSARLTAMMPRQT